MPPNIKAYRVAKGFVMLHFNPCSEAPHSEDAIISTPSTYEEAEAAIKIVFGDLIDLHEKIIVKGLIIDTDENERWLRLKPDDWATLVPAMYTHLGVFGVTPGSTAPAYNASVRKPPVARHRNTVISQSQPVPTRHTGMADIIGFGLDAIYILRNTIAARIIKVSNFACCDGWDVQRHMRLIGNTTACKLSDIIGFGSPGVFVARNNGDNTFGHAQLVLQDFCDVTGWNNTEYVRFVADLRKKGYVDIIGFGRDGVYVSKGNGDGTFGPTYKALNMFGVADGWKIEKHLRFLADTTGNGLPDIVGFGEHAVFVSLNKGDGTFNPPVQVIDDFTYSVGGWRIDQHVRLLGDITGDGKADVVGFGGGGVWVSLNNGDGTFQTPKLVIKDFAIGAGGWEVNKHPRFLADMNGNGRMDIVGFGGSGVWVALSNGDGTFQNMKLVLWEFGYNSNWRVEKHPRFVADLTGNGAADIIGFGDDGVRVSYNDGKGNFAPSVRISEEFGAGAKWPLDKTIRIVGNVFN